MDVFALELFAAAAEKASFSAVARDRNVDASSVSRAIAALEAELGVRLFQRTTRTLSLTEAGQLYLARVRPLLEKLAHAREEMVSTRSDPVGAVRLTASVAFAQLALTPHLDEFQRRFPRLELELLATDANLDLVAERVDVAVRLAPSFRADVIGVKLFATRYRVVASPIWASRHELVRPEDLADTPCLRFSLPEFRFRWLFRRNGIVTEVPVGGSLVASSALVLRQAALDGLGPALLADWMVARDLASGELVDLFPEHDAAATSFDTAAWLLYPSREQLPRKLRLTIDFLRERLRARAEC